MPEKMFSDVAAEFPSSKSFDCKQDQIKNNKREKERRPGVGIQQFQCWLNKWELKQLLFSWQLQQVLRRAKLQANTGERIRYAPD